MPCRHGLSTIRASGICSAGRASGWHVRGCGDGGPAGACRAALVGLGGASLLAACDPQPADYCPALSGLDKWVWDGEVSTSWATAANWDHGGNSNVGVPGERNDAGDADDYVCIPPNKTAVLGDGESAHLQVLDNGGRLVVSTGAKLELKGAPASRTSFSHKLDLHGLLYGRGKLVTRPQGVLSWIHDPAALGAATMSTRENWNTPTALPVPPDPGRTVISPGAKLVVSGLGVNLVDRRIIDNQGVTEITGNGTYVAADWGTTFRNTGTFDFKADGDFVEGSVHGHAALRQGPLHQHGGGPQDRRHRDQRARRPLLAHRGSGRSRDRAGAVRHAQHPERQHRRNRGARQRRRDVRDRRLPAPLLVRAAGGPTPATRSSRPSRSPVARPTAPSPSPRPPTTARRDGRSCSPCRTSRRPRRTR